MLSNLSCTHEYSFDYYIRGIWICVCVCEDEWHISFPFGVSFRTASCSTSVGIRYFLSIPHKLRDNNKRWHHKVPNIIKNKAPETKNLTGYALYEMAGEIRVNPTNCPFVTNELWPWLWQMQQNKDILFETQLKLQLYEISFAHDIFRFGPFVFKFCRAHGRDAAMLCAKFKNDWATQMGIVNERIFTRCEFKICFGGLPILQKLPENSSIRHNM